MPTKLVVNCSTGSEEYVELTADEVADLEAQAEAAKAEQEALQAELDAKAAAKASGDAKLKELGLTDEEIAAR